MGRALCAPEYWLACRRCFALKNLILLKENLNEICNLSNDTDNVCLGRNRKRGFSSFLALLITSYTSIFWCTAIVYIYDLYMAITNNSSLFMKEFYLKLKDDLVVSLISGISLFALLYSAPSTYNLSNVDIAFSGLPFLIYSIVTLFKCGKIKIGRLKLPTKVLFSYIFIQITALIISYYALAYILAGRATNSHSIWIQITILSASLTFFFGSKQILYILTKQRMEVSPALLTLFKSISPKVNLYQDAVHMSNIRNNEVKKEKAENRKLLNKDRRKKGKK